MDAVDFTQALARAVIARGGVIQTQEAVDVRTHRSGINVHTRGGSPLTADAVVIAAGANLSHLATRSGIRPRLRTSHGYAFTVPVDRRIPSPIYLPEAGVTCTPTANGLHIATTRAFHARDAATRLRSIIASVSPLLEAVRWHEHSEVWNGASSLTSDGQPLIGATATPGVYVAGGHDMWGFAHGPVTGRLLAEQITTGTQPDALRAFDPQRAF